MISYSPCSSLFFFNDTATTEIYTLSLHDALPISFKLCSNYFSNYPFLAGRERQIVRCFQSPVQVSGRQGLPKRSEEHTSELQSQSNLVCRLLLEKKKNRVKDETSNASLAMHYR